MTMRRSLGVVLAALAVAALVAMSGCQAVAQKAVESATGVKVNKDGNSVSVQGNDGQSVTIGQSNKLPDGFPEDVPVYDPATVTNSMSLASDKGSTFSVQLETEDTVETVSAWYDTELKGKGWTIKGTMNSADSGALITSEKADQVLSVTIAPGSGSDTKTTIALTYAPK